MIKSSIEGAMKTIVAERGQVTIPKILREKLGIRPGAVLDFQIQNGKLVATKVTSTDPIEQVYGCFGTSLSTDTLLKELRDKA
jgi:AbrB family looped-hinge helix DNA binding protein